MRKRTNQLFSALASGALACAAILGCSGRDVSMNLNAGGGSSNGGASGFGRGGSTSGTVGGPASAGEFFNGGANTDAGTNGLSECNGDAPECRGANLQECCGNDPYGPATCEDGKWYAPSAILAPPRRAATVTSAGNGLATLALVVPGKLAWREPVRGEVAKPVRP